MADVARPRAARAPVPGPQAGDQQQPRPQGGFQSLLGTILRFGLMWYMMRSFNQKGGAGRGAVPAGINGTSSTPGYAVPVYRKGDLLDMRAYLSESPLLADDRQGARLVWLERDVPLAADGGERQRVLRYVPSESVARNQSGLFLHVSFTRAASVVGGDGDGGGGEEGEGSFGKVYNLVSHLPRPKNKTGVNLLSGNAASGSTPGGLMPPKKDKKKKEDAASLLSAIKGAPREIIPFLRPGVGVAMVDHFQAYPRGGIPAPLLPHALLSSDGAGLLPWVWFDDFWQLRDGMYPLNASWVGGGPAGASGGEDGTPPIILPPLPGNATEAALHSDAPLIALHLPSASAAADKAADSSSTDANADPTSQERQLSPEGRKELERLKAAVLSGAMPCATLTLTLKPLSFWRMQIYTQMEQSFKMQVGTGLAQEGESDEIKRIFLEGNPWLLAVTMVVSLLHSVFDFLAFKNDIGFWKENKSLEGLSARSVLVNAFSQLVIFLYLLDNDTSMVVLFSAGAGTAIEFWKITRAFDVEVCQPVGRSWPPLKLKDRAGYQESDTRKHDEVAMRYLTYVLIPLVAGYSIYALVYESHRSWYSWALGSLVGAVYAFGFVLMCPQLYLNYKLKSVAHLPWRQMTYKFLNTIVDDLFAFVIKMPLLHRLSVFRDDVVFLVYIYQRWIYRVDPKRANEFGFSAEDAAASEKKALEGGAQKSGGRGEAERAVSGEGDKGGAVLPAAAGASAEGVRRRRAAEDKDGGAEEEAEDDHKQQPAGEKKDR